VSGASSTPWASSDQDLAAGYDLLLVDLDGVVYVGRHAVPGAAASLARARAAGLRCSFVTNNAARPAGAVAEHLRALGVDAQAGDVVTSAQEGAELLAGRIPPGSRVLAVGGPGVAAALLEVGLEPVQRYDDGVAGVLQGYGPDVGWRDLAEASYAVTGGATWVATNPDLTVPTPRGTAPGNGQLTGVVARTTGVTPLVTGKPGPGLFQSAIRRAGGGRALVVGDRLDTDIAGAVAADLHSLLVLTGVTGPAELLAAGPAERPSYLAHDLSGLWQRHPPVQRADEWWTCGPARARVRAGRLELGAPPAAGPGSDHGGPAVAGPEGQPRLDGWRAACAAVWTATDHGDEVDLATAAASLQSLAR
jgi:HAD superfamily hydrolase (TIGR01450 family)